MDLHATLLILLTRKRQLEGIIAELEELQATVGFPRAERRGRRFMGAEEREEVSRRMTRYWASQRKLKAEEHQA